MRRTSVFSAALLLALAFTLVSREPQTDPRLKKASRAPERNGWIQVHLEGSPSDLGYQHGYLLAPEIQDNFREISTELMHDEKKDWAFFRKTAERSSGRTSSWSTASNLLASSRGSRRTALRSTCGTSSL